MEQQMEFNFESSNRGYHVYKSICFIKLTSSNGYKSQKFVSLIGAPYFKNAFAPGASIRRNTVAEKLFITTTNSLAIVLGYGM
jgi:hypothetical protein